MKYEVIKETLNIDTNINKIDSNFREYLKEVFSPIYVKKIDRVFKEPLVVENFSKDGNVMAVTQGTQIYVNSKMFNDLSTDRAMVYLIHEIFHVLQNVSQFPEVKNVNALLKARTMLFINEYDINKFLTGKEQNIHSDYKDEFLSYCSNNAFDWTLSPQLKGEFKKILNDSGIFNMKSKWWKERF